MKQSHRDFLEATALVLVFVVVFVLGIVLAVNAAEPCTTVSIEHTDRGPLVVDREWVEGAPASAIVGHFVWFDFGETPSGGQSNTLSFDVSGPDIVSATACADGSVHLTTLPVDEAVDTHVETGGGDGGEVGRSSSSSPLTPLCEIHPDTLERYCQLPNLTLIIS